MHTSGGDGDTLHRFANDLTVTTLAFTVDGMPLDADADRAAGLEYDRRHVPRADRQGVVPPDLSSVGDHAVIVVITDPPGNPSASPNATVDAPGTRT